MDEKRCHDICAGCTAACPPPGMKCLFLEDPEELEGALPPMMLDEDVRIDRAVERDAFGYTYEGFDAQTGKSVIIREYLPFGERGENHRICHREPSEQKAFAEGLSRTGRKLAALAKVRHPGLARCYAVMQENDTLYALYEPVEGRALGELWNAIPVIEPRQAAVLFKPVAEALQAMIDSGIEPEKINPQNIMVKNEDGLCVMTHMGTMPAQKDPQASLCAVLCRWFIGKEIPYGNPFQSFPAAFPAAVREVLLNGLSGRYDSIKELWEKFEQAVTCTLASVPQATPEAEPEEDLETTLPVPGTTFEPEEESNPEPDSLLKNGLSSNSRMGEMVTLPRLWENRTFTPDDIWSPEELVRFMGPAVEAIIALAEKKLLEPLQPENFLMEEDGCIRLGDIGSTDPAGKIHFYNDTTATLTPQATMWYIPPELMKEDYDAEKAAQYTLCAILYRMMTTHEIPSWTKRAQPGAKELGESGFSKAVDAVMAKGLSMNPNDRYESIAQMWEKFQKATDGKEQEEVSPEKEEKPLPLDGRCYWCMEKAPSFGECPHCGYDNRRTIEVGAYLPNVTLQGRYLTGRLLGRGGDYATYIGHDELLDQKIAIREYLPAMLAVRGDDGRRVVPLEEQKWRDSFQRKRRENAEIIKMGRFGGVEALYDLFEENGTFYVIKEFVEGQNLLETIQRKQEPLNMEEAETIFRPAVETLIHLHEKGFSHGNIHPGNLMVLPDSRGSMWIDVLNRRNERKQGEKSELSPVRHCFHPIECYSQHSDTFPGLTDQYSLCATLYYALTGQRPPRVSDRMLGVEELKSICEINPSVTPAVEKVIFKGMEVEAQNRYPSMQTWLEAMEKACASHDSGKKKSLWQRLGFHKGK